MIFEPHGAQVGKHASFGASKPAWLNYDDTKFLKTLSNLTAAARGTALHELAHRCIKLGVYLEDNGSAISQYVRDAIGFKMTSEQVLFYSDWFFGTADTICFRNNYLRVHDLKTGVTLASVYQLMIYAALFCLEYEVDPREITTEVRLYQHDLPEIWVLDPQEILAVMGKIIHFNNLILAQGGVVREDQPS